MSPRSHLKQLSRRFAVRLIQFCLVTLAAKAGLKCNLSWADKVELNVGGYNLVATDPKKTQATASGPGVYNIQYSYNGISQLSLQVGYTLIMSNGVGGDLANGLDFGASYYPLSQNGTRVWKESDNLIRSGEVWRPFVGLSFLQRQVESASFSGFSVKAGVERTLMYPWALKGELKRSSYSSSSDYSSVETTGMVGGILEF